MDDIDQPRLGNESMDLHTGAVPGNKALLSGSRREMEDGLDSRKSP